MADNIISQLTISEGTSAVLSKFIELLILLKNVVPSAGLDAEYRKEFEQQVRSTGSRVSLKRFPDGEYVDEATEHAWRRSRDAQAQNDLSI